MCSLEGKKCIGCYEYVVHSDSDFNFRFTFDEDEADNEVIKSWLFATDYVDSIDIRKVGDTVWSNISKREWENGQA
jgi:hypothetical protein